MNDWGARRTKLKRPMAKCNGSILSRAAKNYDRAGATDVRVSRTYTTPPIPTQRARMQLLEFRGTNRTSAGRCTRYRETCTSVELRLVPHAPFYNLLGYRGRRDGVIVSCLAVTSPRNTKLPSPKTRWILIGNGLKFSAAISRAISSYSALYRRLTLYTTFLH